MNTIKILLYLLAALTCFACTFFLTLGYLRKRVRLLLWCALCFVGLAISNLFLFLDLVMFPTHDLRLVRLLAALVGMLFMLYGFIWEIEEQKENG